MVVCHTTSGPTAWMVTANHPAHPAWGRTPTSRPRAVATP